jgi:hypothetical protein
MAKLVALRLKDNADGEISWSDGVYGRNGQPESQRQARNFTVSPKTGSLSLFAACGVGEMIVVLVRSTKKVPATSPAGTESPKATGSA